MNLQRVYKAEGIILKRKNVGEADRIITIFTNEYGKLRCIAKGIRKISSRRGPRLEVFTHVQVIIHRGKSMESITDVESVDMYEKMRQDLQRVSLGYYLCDLVDSLLPEKQEHRDVFLLLSSAFNALQTADSTSLYRQIKIFSLELLWVLGFLPREKSLNGKELQTFIETITERRLKSTHFARHLLELART